MSISHFFLFLEQHVHESAFMLVCTVSKVSLFRKGSAKSNQFLLPPLHSQVSV